MRFVWPCALIVSRITVRIDRCSLICLVTLLWAGLVADMQSAFAQELPGEHAVRAAMVFNFLKFSELPREIPAKAQTLEICLAVEDGRQADALLALSGRKVAGREVNVMPLNTSGGDCDVLYVDTLQRWQSVRARHAVHGVMTISGYPGFASAGGMMEIAVQPDGARFDVNLGEARNAGIRFSPQMLRLARRVHE